MKQFIVTDPCYLITRDNWNQIISQCETENYKLDEEMLNKKLAQHLNEMAATRNSVVADTGDGDWSNKMIGPSDKIVFANFTADSGLVCVVEYTDQLKGQIEFDEGFMALVNVDDNAIINMDTTNKSWTVVEITDSSGVLSSLGYETNEEEDDYDYDDDDDDYY